MQTHFIRTYDSPYGIDRIDPASIYYLFDRHQTVTSLILDTNVLIDMAQIVMRGNHSDLLKGHRISGLVDFLKNTPPMAVNIMPGIAFDECPAEYVGIMNDYFQAFCAKHLPGWCDTPDCISVGDDALNVAQETIHSLPPAYMAGMAVPYCLLLKINMLHRMRYLSAREKFDAYIDYACNQLNCLSFKETEIAKHCFFDQYELNEIKPELFRKIRDNFTKKTTEKIPKIFLMLLILRSMVHLI